MAGTPAGDKVAHHLKFDSSVACCRWWAIRPSRWRWCWQTRARATALSPSSSCARTPMLRTWPGARLLCMQPACMHFHTGVDRQMWHACTQRGPSKECVLLHTLWSPLDQIICNQQFIHGMLRHCYSPCLSIARACTFSRPSLACRCVHACLHAQLGCYVGGTLQTFCP